MTVTEIGEDRTGMTLEKMVCLDGGVFSETLRRYAVTVLTDGLGKVVVNPGMKENGLCHQHVFPECLLCTSLVAGVTAEQDNVLLSLRSHAIEGALQINKYMSM